MRISSIFLYFVVLGLFFSGVFLSCKDIQDQITFTVKFDTQEGSAVKSQVVEKGKKATKPTDPTRTGYDFGGWYGDKGFTKSFDFNTNITANITLYARWLDSSKPTFTVKFDTQEGSAVKSQVVEKGQKATKPADPTRTDYNFMGWYADKDFQQVFDFDNNITGDTTLYAKWTRVTFTVSFDLQEGIGDVKPQVVKKGEKATKPTDPTRTNYAFAGWHKDAGGSQIFNFAVDTITSNITLYARWLDSSKPTFTVTFDTQKGRSVPSQKVTLGQKVAQFSPTIRTGYEFVGWYKDAGGSQIFNFAVDTITADITLYAVWKVLVFTVTFDTQGGDGVIPSQEVIWSKKVSKPTDPIRTGYEFVGWHRDAGGNQIFDFAVDTITAPTTLYAVWKVLVFTVTFDKQGGTGIIPSREVIWSKKVSKPTDPIRTGYEFVGWHRDAGGSQIFNFAVDTITSNITLYAVWKVLVFTVTFDTQGGDGIIPPQEVIWSKKVSKPTDPIRTGYEFVGWHRDSTVSLTFNFDEDTITSATTLYAGWGVVISDANFRAKLKAKVPNAFIGDLLITRRRDVTELKSLDVRGLNRARIASLSGIEYFTSLTTLDCSFNSFTSLDVSKNVSLTTLDCSFNSFTSLDVSKNVSLTTLDCRFIRLTSLDVSKNVSLTNLDCSSTSLTTLDVSQNTVLDSLNCSSTSLTTLDVSTNVSLTSLWCSRNNLTRLDVSTNVSLTSLKCASTGLTTLDVSKNVSLTSLKCASNSLTTLDVSRNTVLDSLDCTSNSLTTLDTRGMRSLTYLSVNAGAEGKNPITELKVHDALKNHAEIKEAKTNRGSNITIPTYSAASGSTSYTLTCTNYDPNGNVGAGSCTQGP